MRSEFLRRTGVWLVLAIVAVPGGLVVGHLSSGGATSRAAPPLGPASVPSSVAPAAAVPSIVAEHLAALEEVARTRGIPLRDLHPPNLAGEASAHPGVVQPGYSQGPAPMGISDLGVENVSGTLVPYVVNTTSVWGSLDLTRVQTAYVDGDGPDTFGVQLNAVVANVTLSGVGGFQFWTQDFFSYTSSTHNLSFGDNVWNFSSPFAGMPQGVFASNGPNGTLVPGVYYYAVGPSLTVAYPFTVNLYLNASVVGAEPAVYFNYSVTNASGRVAGGTFDYVAFNASGSAPPSTSAAPEFQINGTGVGPSNLGNDAELVLVGDGDGDTTTVFAVNATMSLEEWSATHARYEAPRAAYDAGSDTGETSNGVLPVWRNATAPGPPTVSLETGPSYVEGLWNVSAALDGARAFHVTQRQQNAFLFVSPGATFNASSAQWVPTLRLGASASDFVLPNTGTYSLVWLLSDRDPLNTTVDSLFLPNSTTSFAVNLTLNASEGAYTPLLAWGNGELPFVVQAGNGTAGNPYVLIHRSVGPLDPVFDQLNDFGFPVFAGVLLVNTSSYVDVIQPSVAISFPSWMTPQLLLLDLPSTNSLQLEFWNVSHVVVANSTDLTGWLSENFYGIPAAEVLFWGSSGNLVAGNTFHDQGVALTLYGGRNNTLWGNTILAAAASGSLYDGNNSTGLVEWEDGDLVYDNYFGVQVPAVTPTYDAFSCQVVCLAATYNDSWNVSLAPANASRLVLGERLTGSIIGTWYQGGNYWWNYGTPSDPYGVLPYNDSGRINAVGGGDYLPLTLQTLYAVTFDAQGLVPGAAWNVSVLGVSANSTNLSAVLWEPNGSYNATVGVPAGYLGPALVPFVVNGTNLSVDVNFTELFSVTVTETGLAEDWSWSVWFNATSAHAVPASFSSTTTTGGTELVNGTYGCVAEANGYFSASLPARLTVRGHTVHLSVSFSLVPLLVVAATGLAAGAPWTVTVVQTGSPTVSETGVGDGSVVFTVLELDRGPYSWSVSAPGYTTPTPSGTGDAPTPETPTVAFSANSTAPVGFDRIWLVVGALAALTVAGFALYLDERRRGRRPPKPMAPAPALAPPAGAAAGATAAAGTPWDETTVGQEKPSANAPWEEAPTDQERPEPYGPRP